MAASLRQAAPRKELPAAQTSPLRACLVPQVAGTQLSGAGGGGGGGGGGGLGAFLHFLSHLLLLPMPSWVCHAVFAPTQHGRR